VLPQSTEEKSRFPLYVVSRAITDETNELRKVTEPHSVLFAEVKSRAFVVCILRRVYNESKVVVCCHCAPDIVTGNGGLRDDVRWNHLILMRKDRSWDGVLKDRNALDLLRDPAWNPTSQSEPH
jgi:hypothetical protein